MIERQNIENERQRKMADLANRQKDGGIPSDLTLRSVSISITFTCHSQRQHQHSRKFQCFTFTKSSVEESKHKG